MRISLSSIAVFILLVSVLGFGLLLATPTVTDAIAFCPCCGMKCLANKPCSGPPPCVFVPCPSCSDLACTGMCLPGPGVPTQCDVKPGSCKGQPEKGSPQGAQKAMDMAKGLLDALKGLQGGGGGAPPGGGSPPPPSDQQLGNQLGDTPLLGDVFGGGGTITPARSEGGGLFGNIFGGTGGSAGEDNKGEPKNLAQDILSSIFGGSGKTQEKATSTEIKGTTYEAAQEQLGESGVTYEVGGEIITGEGVTVTGSGRDEKTRTGLAGFFGRFFGFGDQARLEEQGTFFARLCTERPWQSTFITRIFSASFFDSLCTRQGYGTGDGATGNFFYGDVQAGRATLTCSPKVKLNEMATIAWDCAGSQSSSAGFNTEGRASGSASILPDDTRTYALRCANGGYAQCLIEVIKPRAQIVAYPEHVPLGARTRIYWTSENSAECLIEGPGFKERGLRGAATTAAVLDTATFIITCRSDDGFEAYDSVVVEPGS